jgi:hypothetical protein
LSCFAAAAVRPMMISLSNKMKVWSSALRNPAVFIRRGFVHLRSQLNDSRDKTFQIHRQSWCG